MKERAVTKLHPLEVVIRHTATATGPEEVDVMVHCPLQQRPVNLDDCIACEYCGGVTMDPSGRESFLMCRVKPEAPAPPAPRVEPHARLAGQTPVTSIMSRKVVCVAVGLSVERLTELLLEHGISGAPVVDDEGKPIGIVTKTDLLREQQDRNGVDETDVTNAPPLRVRARRGVMVELGPGFHEERLLRATVGEIMTPVAFTLKHNATVAEAAARMTSEGVHRLPVVDEGGRVIGILSAMDVLRWIAGQIG